jgi:hypothetical protein
MLNVIMPSVFMLNVIVLTVIILYGLRVKSNMFLLKLFKNVKQLIKFRV